MKSLIFKPPIIYCVMWSDTHCVIDGQEPDFLHSVHGSRKGAIAEMRRQRKLVGRGGSTSYTLVKREILP